MRRAIIRWAVLLGAAQGAMLSSACAGGPDAKTAGERDDAAREADARKTLKYARRTDTAKAYMDVMQRFKGTVAADEAQMELARIRADEARAAIGRGDMEAARKLATEAMQLGDSSIASQARVTLEQVDRADGRKVSKRVEKMLSEDQSAETCGKAAADVAKTLGKKPSKVLLGEVRKRTLQPLSGCLDNAIRAAKEKGSFANVRKVLDKPETKEAIGDDTWFALSNTLGEAVLEIVAAKIEPHIKKGEWKEAFATIDKWAAQGHADSRQVEEAKQGARDLITKALLKRGRAALGTPKATTALADIDAALAVFKGLNVSEELKTLRSQLAASAECKRIRCTAVTRPSVAYNFGATPLRPPHSTTASPVKSLPNATKVWVLARGRGFSLVALEQPSGVGKWGARLAASRGWVDSSALKTQDTSTWLPMGKALENVRVWLPTGKNDKLYLLGVVTKVDDKEVTVKRLSDNGEATHTREDLRSGVLVADAKLLAFCQDTLSLNPAKFQQIAPNRSSMAQVMCLKPDETDDRSKNVLLGSLRAKLEWLPPRKP